MEPKGEKLGSLLLPQYPVSFTSHPQLVCMGQRGSCRPRPPLWASPQVSLAWPSVSGSVLHEIFLIDILQGLTQSLAHFRGSKFNVTQ